MKIDFHTHVFPERIASQAIHKLSESAGLTADFDGTLSGLLESMDNSGVDISVVLPIATSAKQHQGILDYSVLINKNPRIVAFSSVHPLAGDDSLLYLEKAAEAGLSGIKLHPDYQRCYIDSEHTIAVVKRAQQLDLIISFHTGRDIGLPPPTFATVDRMSAMLDKCGDKNIVFAHMGGEDQWEAAHNAFLNSGVYFDLAFTLRRLDSDQMCRFIQQRGSDKYLFATDAPWSSQTKDAAAFSSLPLPAECMDNILFKNACTLLNLPAGEML